MPDEVSPSGFILLKCEYLICPAAAAAHLNASVSPENFNSDVFPWITGSSSIVRRGFILFNNKQ